jgi:hypothetical protein
MPGIHRSTAMAKELNGFGIKWLLAGLAVCVTTSAIAQFQPSGDAASGRTGRDYFGAPEGGPFATNEEFFVPERSGERSFALKSRPPANPTAGPTTVYVYQNSEGFWKLPPANTLATPFAGSAKYRWPDGTNQEDKLTYIAHGYVTDKGGYLIPPGTRVSVWAVMASDNAGNCMFFYFGTDAIINAPQGRRYPMYWSWESPHSNPVTHRFVSTTGTVRF